MNPKSRSELQRKLSLNAVPRPPAGLAERIKADIPKYLEADPDRERFAPSFAFNMRIAASILLVVTSVALTVFLVSPETEKSMTADTATAVFAPAPRGLPRAAAAPTEEVRLEISQEAGLPEIPPQIAMSTPPPPPVATRSREQDNVVATEAARADSIDERKFAGEVAGAVAAPQQVAEFAPVVPPPPPPAYDSAAAAPAAVPEPAPAPAPAPVRTAHEESVTVTAEAPRLSIMQAGAAKMSTVRKDEVFGISIDPSAFQRIRETLENGQRPASSSVDVEALVNYFAAAAASSPRRGMNLEVEASPAAIEADGDHAILRFTLDAAKPDAIPSGSVPPIAADARIEIEFDDDVVKRAHRVGGSSSLPSEPVLFSGTSVTGLYALEMHPNLKATQTVATVRLHYKSIPEGRKHTITRKVRASDLPRNWSNASRRHRLASLGALWGETLKGTGTGGAVAVAQRAEELATQKPDDRLARDLAAAANASSGGGR
jgi:hypothetical protein